MLSLAREVAERFNEGLKSRTRVVRIFPNREACLRLVTAMCVEQSEVWLSGRKYLDMELLDSAAASTTTTRKEVGLAA